jgi:hypothetical protein
MSRNVNSRFSINPSVDVSRSKFVRNSSVKTTFNAGELIPFYVDEVLPGDTFSIDTSRVVRLQTLLTPIMDNLYLDTYYFFVPNRLVWDHWQAFMGENIQSAWIPQVEYSIPKVTAPSGGWSVGTIADYMGVPTGVSNLSINALPFRAYGKIVDDWFRDENLQDPVNISKGDATVAGVNTGEYITDLVKGGQPFVAGKYHDYFTSALPSPQKGPDVKIPVASGDMPVYATLNSVPSSGFVKQSSGNYVGASFVSAVSQGVSRWNVLQSGPSGSPTATGSFASSTEQFPDNDSASAPTNLWAIATGDAAAASINDLRLAFAMQKLYEKDARGGTRYISLLKTHFGVTSPDARLQRSEYLGGNRVPININQVVQNSGTASGTTPQGTVTAMSVTADRNSDFTKSFVEHGFVIGLMVARYDHTYQQGLERMWSRTNRFDFYWPVFQSLGEQPILNKEIYAQGTDVDDEVFGYQEAWAEYRYKPNRVSAQMRSSATANYDIWHLADDYESLPTLSAGWIQEDTAIVDRVLAVKSTVSDQFIADIYVQNTTTRPMPMYSIPGLIDHF